jgi:hypothetical protein
MHKSKHAALSVVSRNNLNTASMAVAYLAQRLQPDGRFAEVFVCSDLGIAMLYLMTTRVH